MTEMNKQYRHSYIERFKLTEEQIDTINDYIIQIFTTEGKNDSEVIDDIITTFKTDREKMYAGYIIGKISTQSEASKIAENISNTIMAEITKKTMELTNPIPSIIFNTLDQQVPRPDPEQYEQLKQKHEQNYRNNTQEEDITGRLYQ